MNSLFKLVIWIAPIFAVVFLYYIYTSRHHEEKMDIESLMFDREWHQSALDFATSKEERQYHLQKIREIDQKIAELREKEEESKRKAREFEQEFDRAMKEFNKEVKDQLLIGGGKK